MGTSAPLLTAHSGQFYRAGQPHRILSGAVHYFRVHPDLWRDRLERLRAMGLNTVDTYVAWNFHEPREGEIDFTGWRDVAAFIRLAGELGFDVLLRPSPYICAEWSNGGFPVWLTGRTAALRTSDPDFLAAIDRWYDALLPHLVPLQAAHGGPIVAVQVENEYGSFGGDTAYLEHLRDALRSRGIVEMLTTADGTTADMVARGSVSGAVPTVTFGTGVDAALAVRKPEDPLMCSELWGGWFDHWGEKHHVRSAASLMGTVRDLLGAGGSVSLYMAHGGTNFGLWAGANHDQVLQPTVTSYDSDAPVGEDGSVGAKFEALRQALHEISGQEMPPEPQPMPVLPATTVPLVPAVALASLIAQAPAIGAQTPQLQTFEQLGVSDGMVIYETDLDLPNAVTCEVNGLHDRAIVLRDGQRIAVLERDGETSFGLAAGTGTLTIVVESLGRINYGPLLGEHKGILGGVTINRRRYLHGWRHRVLDGSVPTVQGEAGGDGVAVASVTVETPADGWLAFPGGVHGWVWLNGFLLGRYRAMGPQVTLYAPAPLWRAGANEIVVLDTDQLGQVVEVRERCEYGPTEEFIGS